MQFLDKLIIVYITIIWHNTSNINCLFQTFCWKPSMVFTCSCTKLKFFVSVSLDNFDINIKLYESSQLQISHDLLHSPLLEKKGNKNKSKSWCIWHRLSSRFATFRCTLVQSKQFKNQFWYLAHWLCKTSSIYLFTWLVSSLPKWLLLKYCIRKWRYALFHVVWARASYRQSHLS